MTPLQEEFKNLLWERFNLELANINLSEEEVEDFVSLWAVEAELDRLKNKFQFVDTRDLEPSSTKITHL